MGPAGLPLFPGPPSRAVGARVSAGLRGSVGVGVGRRSAWSSVGPRPPPCSLGRSALGSARGAGALGPPRSRLLHHPLQAGRGNEPPSARPPRHCLRAGVKPGLRGALEGDRARGCEPRFTPAPAPAPSPGPGRRVLALPAGGVSAGPALGKEAVERPATARGGAINLEQMRPDSHRAREVGRGGGRSTPGSGPPSSPQLS